MSTLTQEQAFKYIAKNRSITPESIGNTIKGVKVGNISRFESNGVTPLTFGETDIPKHIVNLRLTNAARIRMSMELIAEGKLQEGVNKAGMSISVGDRDFGKYKPGQSVNVVISSYLNKEGIEVLSIDEIHPLDVSKSTEVSTDSLQTMLDAMKAGKTAVKENAGG